MLSQGSPSGFSGPSLSDFLSAETSSVSDTDEPSCSPGNLAQAHIATLDLPSLGPPFTELDQTCGSASMDCVILREISISQTADVETGSSLENGNYVADALLNAPDTQCQRIPGCCDTLSINIEPSSHEFESRLYNFNGTDNDQCQSGSSQIDKIPRQLDSQMSDVAEGSNDSHCTEMQPRALNGSVTLSVGAHSEHAPKLDMESSSSRMTLFSLLNPENVAVALSASVDSPYNIGSSHPTKAHSCEIADAPSTETFKSPDGHSDDILPRRDLNEEMLTTKSDNLSTSYFPYSKDLDDSTAPGSIRLASHLPDNKDYTGLSSSQQYAPDDSLHIELTGQTKHSHEETDLDHVSDHSGVASSSPATHTECLLSNSYFEAATITRTPSPDIRAESVGSDDVPSSSPPSSPSMNSNYLPSSSPIPSSSPVDESHQMPSSSPLDSSQYRQAIPLRDFQEGIYVAENQSLPLYPINQMYYKPPEQAQRLPQDASYYTAPLSSSQNSANTPFDDYYDHIAETSAPLDNAGQYLQNGNSYTHPPIVSIPSRSFPSVSMSNTVIGSTSFSNSPAPYAISTIDSTRQNNAPYHHVQVPRDYDPNTYDHSSFDPTHYGSSVPHQNITPPSDVNPMVSIPQAPDNSIDNVVPRPKRTTLAGHRQQQKKLSKPFRSPVLHAPVRLAPKPVPPEPPVPIIKSTILIPSSSKDDQAIKTTEKSSDVVTASSSTSPPKPIDTNIKHRTARASSQFKSPLAAAATPLDQATLVRLTPTIQSLERKLQLLRRALKVREDVQEEVLEGLVKKWSEAGREAALEVWDAVKDNTTSDGAQSESRAKGKKRAIEENWGWDDTGDRKKPKGEESSRNWGWDVIPVSDRGEEEPDPEEAERNDEASVAETKQEEEEEESAPQPTLGTMLLQLGIAPETLGWDEEEGGFVDDT